MKKDDNEKPLYVSSSYVRRVADELGVQIESGKLAQQLAEAVTLQLRDLIDQARRYGRRSRRHRLLARDIDDVLADRGAEPLIGVRVRAKKRIQNGKETLWFEPPVSSELTTATTAAKSYTTATLGVERLPLVYNADVTEHVKGQRRKSSQLTLPVSFDVYFQMLKGAMDSGTLLARYCHHIGTVPETSQLLPFIGWLIERQAGADSLIPAANLLLVLDSLMTNRHVAIESILPAIVAFACRLLVKTEDLDPVYRGHEITVRERSALLLNKCLQCPSFDSYDAFNGVKRRQESFLGLVIEMPLSKASTLLIPTSNPLALVRFALRCPFCPVHAYLAKEFPYIIAPYFHHPTSNTNTTNTAITRPKRLKFRRVETTPPKYRFDDFFDERAKSIKPRKKLITVAKPLKITTYFGTVKLINRASLITDTPAYSINVKL